MKRKKRRKEEKKRIMKSRKFIKFQVMGMVLMLAMSVCGCGQKEMATEPSTMESSEVIGSKVEEVLVETEESIEEVKEPVTLAAGFDEDFVIKVGETLYVGREDISIQLRKYLPDEYGIFIYYTLTIDGKCYDGNGFYGYYVEPSVSQDIFTENRVRLINADEEGSVTLQITETTEIKKPLVLSGNAEDEYVTTQPEYVEKGNTILFLDEGVKVYGNTMELIETLFMLAEKETGLKWDNDSEYAHMKGDGPGWLFGNDTFAGVDPNAEKYHIYVVPYEKCAASASGYFIVVNPLDLEIANGEGMALIHEHIHNLHLANGVSMDRTMDEGYATYMTGRIADRDEVLNINFDSKMNYSGYKDKITKENAEDEFKVIADPDWEEYLYGYRFMTFLFETYGENIFKDILETANEKTNNASIPAADMVPIVKQNTSETVFEDFADWLKKNSKKFEY